MAATRKARSTTKLKSVVADKATEAAEIVSTQPTAIETTPVEPANHDVAIDVGPVQVQIDSKQVVEGAIYIAGYLLSQLFKK